MSEKFTQPVDGIKVIKRSGSRTLLTEDILDIGRSRIADGEDPDEVTRDLAMYEVSLMPPPSYEARSAGGAGSGNFGHSGRPGEKGGSTSYYHGTISEFVDGIKKNGLVRSQSGKIHPDLSKNSVYLTKSRSDAYEWGKVALRRREAFEREEVYGFNYKGMHPSTHVTVVEVHIPKNKVGYLRPDRNFVGNNRELEFEHDVDPKWIKSISVLDPETSEWRAAEVSSDGEEIVYFVLLVTPTGEIKQLGGQGSGNFGHGGRPGERGGSSSEGGSKEEYPKAREGASMLKEKGGLNTLEQYLHTNGKLTKERRVLHDKIVEDALKGKTPVENPTVYLMGGGPASGKSVLSKEIDLPANHVLVDPDTVRTKFPEWDAELKAAKEEGRQPHALLAAYTHEEASMLAKRIGAEAAKRGMNVVADGTGNSTLESITRKVEGYRANGHRVVANYVTVDTDEAVRRAFERGKETGRFVPETYLRTVHASVSDLFPKALKNGLFDEVALWDTSVHGKPAKVLSGKRENVVIHEPEMYQRFLSKAKGRK